MSKRTLDLNESIRKALIQVPFQPKKIVLSNHSFAYMRIEIPIPEIDLLGWLANQTLFPKIYFENPKTNMKVAGVGAAYTLDEIPSFNSKSASARFFGGMNFFERKSQMWSEFPACYYILPLVEIEQRGNLTYLCVNRTDDYSNLSNIQFNFCVVPTMRQHPVKRLDIPSFPVWMQNINHSLQLIQKQAIDKIVLARTSLFEFEKSLSPFAFCQALQGKSPTATIFAYQFSPNATFIGATPESLYQREKYFLKTAAIAGTRPRGKTEEEDQALQVELLNNRKELSEFNIVKDEIHRQLASLCVCINKQSKDRIIQTSTVQHIYHSFEGTLHQGIDDASIIQALHPTSAVGGVPKHRTLQEIRRLETFDRGWYAAPVGWVSQDQAHLLVAIRSALIQKNQLCLFAGTGLVADSLPEKEWEELEHKISQFIIW